MGKTGVQVISGKSKTVKLMFCKSKGNRVSHISKPNYESTPMCCPENCERGIMPQFEEQEKNTRRNRFAWENVKMHIYLSLFLFLCRFNIFHLSGTSFLHVRTAFILS